MAKKWVINIRVTPVMKEAVQQAMRASGHTTMTGWVLQAMWNALPEEARRAILAAEEEIGADE